MSKADLLLEYQQEKSALITARAAVLSGQEYTIKDRSLKRADLAEINRRIKELNKSIYALENGGGSTFRPVIPRDR